MSMHNIFCLPSGVRAVLTRFRYARSFSTSPFLLYQAPNESLTSQLPSKWLSDTKHRIGKCIMFGCNKEQVREAGSIAEELALNWREIIAGSEGFLTTEGRRGVFKRQIEWGEQDSMGHVNNAIYNRYAETARVMWAYNIATLMDPAHKEEWSHMWTSKSTGMILRRMEVDFKFPLQFPDRITVLHKLRSKPLPLADNFTLDVLILSELHQRPAARCVEDIVLYDYKEGIKTPMKPFMVEIFQKIWEEQEEARRIGSSKLRELLHRVTKLEKGSWDREGAVEQFGAK